MKTYHDIEEIMQHLSAQDAELLKQSHMIIHLLKAPGIPLEQVAAIQNTGDVAPAEVKAQEIKNCQGRSEISERPWQIRSAYTRVVRDRVMRL
jgi:hypothetical protein